MQIHNINGTFSLSYAREIHVLVLNINTPNTLQIHHLSLFKTSLLTGVGWPSRSEPIVLSLARSDVGNRPASAQAAYRIGAAWPWETKIKMLVSAMMCQRMDCTDAVFHSTCLSLESAA